MEIEDDDFIVNNLLDEMDVAIEEADKMVIRGTAFLDQANAYLRDIKLKWESESRDDSVSNVESAE